MTLATGRIVCEYFVLMVSSADRLAADAITGPPRAAKSSPPYFNHNTLPYSSLTPLQHDTFVKNLTKFEVSNTENVSHRESRCSLRSLW